MRWAARFRRERYQPGEVIIRQTDRPTAFYVVDQGELRAFVQTKDQDLLRAYFYPGEVFGGLGLLTGETYDVTIDAVNETELLVLDHGHFVQLVEQFPNIHEKLLERARQRKEVRRRSFPWEQPDEFTVFFSTKHWIALLSAWRWTFFWSLLALVATIIYLGPGQPALLAAILMVAAGTLWAVAVLSCVYHYLDWRNDHYIITNLRVLHVERVLLLREDRDEAPIERVQDVQVLKAGVLANLLNYGDVLIQTAAATQRVVFASIPNPDQVSQAIRSAMKRVSTQGRSEERQRIQQEIERILQVPEIAPEEQVAAMWGEEKVSSVGEGAEVEVEPVSVPLHILYGVGEWLREAFTFQTWIESEDGKTITWRKNGWRLVRVSLGPLAAGFTAGFLFLFFLSQRIGFPAAPLILLFVLGVIFLWWFYVYWDWQNDIYQISGDRVIDLKKRPLFLEQIRRETTLDRIQNISLTIPSAVAQLLNYGTVVIETAAEIGDFKFQFVHNPRGVQEEIFRRLAEFREQQLDQQRQERHQEMAMWFEEYEAEKRRQQEGADFSGG
jgi:hypothetical protein